jgi:hypothetical protein
MSIDYARSSDEQSFFKSIPEDWYEKTDGNVESPSGWFGVVYVDTEMRIRFGLSENVRIPSTIPDGSYFVTIDNNGLIWAEAYSRDEYDSPSGAYSRALTSFREWDSQEGEGEY